MNAELSGIVLLKKPTGITSFKALGEVKKALGHGKVGHAGTLDKFADGLLIAAAGSTTRLLSIFESLRKSYRATLHFGFTTDTLDPEGQTVREAPVPDLDTINSCLVQFRGVIQQVPPVYSALHIAGERASELARKGETPEMKSREVTIHRLEILDWRPPLLTLVVECSKGTYIRSLARDLGEAAGSAACLQVLTRTAIGPFPETDAVTPGDFDPCRDLREPGWFFERIPGIETAEVLPGFEKKITNGMPFREEWLQKLPRDDQLALCDREGRFLAFLYRKGDMWKYRMVQAGGYP